MPYSIPADQILPLLPPPEPQPVSSPNFDSGVPPRPRTPPRLTINTTPPTPTSPSSGGDVRSPMSTRGYLQYSPTSTHVQYSPTTPQHRPTPYSSGRAGHRRSYTYMYPHLDEGAGANGNGRTNTNGTNANHYDIHSTPLNNHLPRRRSASTASPGGQAALGSTTGETATANGTTMNVSKKHTFQLGQPDDDDDDASASEDEISSDSDNSSHFDANINADAPPSITHPHPHPQPLRSKAPHLHPHQTHTHIPLHPHMHTHVRQHQQDQDEEERHPGLPPLKLKLKQQREPSFGAVPFPRSSPLHSPVPVGVAVPAASPGGGSSGGVGAVGRQGAYPFPYTPPSVSKSGSQPQPQPTEPTQMQTQTHLRVSSETTTSSNALSNTTSSTTSNTTNPTRPTFQRASSTPLILLANGRPLKSSLKSSSSSPNIPFPSQSMVPSILWPDLHQRAGASAEGSEREGEEKRGGEQGQGLLEPERHHTVHQRAASAPSVPSSISSSGAPSSPPTQPPLPSSSSSSSSSTNHNHSHPHVHRNPHAHHAHAHAHAPAPHKNVHFPSSEDGGLATVRVFNRSARPASLSLPAGARLGEETETETEGTGTEGEGWGGVMRWRGFGTGKGHWFPRVNGPAGGASAGASGKPEMPPVGKEGDVQIDDEKSSYIPRMDAHLGDANVYLESLGFVRDATPNRPAARPLKIIGTILVRNIAYQKTVAVRFTLDDWHTTNDVLAKHERSLGALPEWFRRSGAGVQDHEKRVIDDVGNSSSTPVTPVWDRFRFDIRMSDYEESVRGGRVRGMWIVARYSTDGSRGPEGGGVGAGWEGKAREWWDNNAGGNYWVGFRCVSGGGGGGGKERERRRALVSAPSAYSPPGNPNANPANSLTAGGKKAFPAPPQISASRSFPAYYSPSSPPSYFSPSSYSAPSSSPPYSPLSGYHRPRTHANAATEDLKQGEYDEGRTPTQAPMDRYQQHQVQLQRQEQQKQLQQAQLQQHQQHQAALKQCTFSRLSRLNLGRMNYAAPAGAAAVAVAKVVGESSGSTGTSPISPGTSPMAMIGTPSPDNSACTSVESTPVQTPTQVYEDDHDHDGSLHAAHDVNVDVLPPDLAGVSFSAVRGGERHFPSYMGMQNGHPATVVELENMKSGTPTPVSTPRGSSTPGMEMRMVASTPPFSELGDVGVKVTTPPISSISSPATATATAPSSSSLYWPWGSEVGSAEFSGVGVGVETRARTFDDHDHEHGVEGGRSWSGKTTRSLSPPVADLLRDIKERNMRGSNSTGVGGALVPPQRRRRGTQGPQQHNQKDQHEEEEADSDQRRKSTTFSIGGSSSSSTSSSGSDTPSSKSKHHTDGHLYHHHKHRKHVSPSGVLAVPPAPVTQTTSGPNSTTTSGSTGTGSSSAGASTSPTPPTPTWALRPGSPHPLSGIGMGKLANGSGNGTRSASPRRVGMGSVVQPVITPVSSQASMATGMEPSSTTPLSSSLSSSPPRSPQQTEDPVYQAFVRQWCFAQAPGPTVGGSVSVGGRGGGRNGHGLVGIGGTGRASSTPSSGVPPGGGGGVSLGGVGVGVDG